MKGRIKEDDFSVPAPDGAHAYFVRYRRADNIRSSAASAVMAGRTVLLDGDALANGKPFFQLGGTRHSPDHRLLAW